MQIPTIQSNHGLSKTHSAPGASSRRKMRIDNTGFLCFPFSNFRYSLTLFSKFFASFPHGTCTLSVSHQYLDLERIYVPLWAAIPSNPTRWKQLPHIWHSRQERESHPLCCPFPRDLAQNVNWRCFFTLQLGTEQSLYRFTKWSLPGSVALTEGILVSVFSFG